MTDDEIIAALQSNNETARNNAMRQLLGLPYRNMIRSFLFKNNGNESHVDELHQTALLELFDQIQRGKYQKKNNASLKTYIYVIVRNHWLKELQRNAKHYVTIEDTEQLPIDSSADTVSWQGMQQASEMLDKVLMEFSQIAANCVKLLKDTFYYNLGDGEIAPRYNIASVTTVRTRRLRCLVKLRAMCEKRGLSFSSFITTAYEA
jgi:RNA polymerase sigma factor (sigma-70 family)